ncbi:hypothetical protein TNCV_2244881 [Trichonephila clavipes]|nr:hypothetical protein TNCV_2244881 [Trichonephila clavipes]
MVWHVMSSSLVPLKIRRKGERSTLNQSRLKRLPVCGGGGLKSFFGPDWLAQGGRAHQQGLGLNNRPPRGGGGQGHRLVADLSLVRAMKTTEETPYCEADGH